MNKEYYPLVTTLLSDNWREWLLDLLDYKSDSFFSLYAFNDDINKDEKVHICVKYDQSSNMYKVFDMTYDSFIYYTSEYLDLFYFFNDKPFFNKTNDNYDDIVLSKINNYNNEEIEENIITDEEAPQESVEVINNWPKIDYSDYKAPDQYFYKIYHHLKDFVENKYNNYGYSDKFIIKYIDGYLRENIKVSEEIFGLERDEKYCYYDKYRTGEMNKNRIYLDRNWKIAKDISFYIKYGWRHHKYKDSDIMYATNSIMSYLRWKNIKYIK